MLAASADAHHAPAATVLELSCLSLRVGCAGELDPQAEVSTAVGVASGSLTLPSRTGRLRFPLNPLELLQDTDIALPLTYDTSTHANSVTDGEALAFALEFLLGPSGSQYYSKHPPIQHPILVAEPAVTDVGLREALSQCLFETLNGTGLTFYKQPALATFGCGRVSGLVWGVASSGICLPYMHHCHTCRLGI